MSSGRFSLIAAVSKKNSGIGFQNKLPWHFKEDLEHFKRITTGKTVIMGRKTWQSLPKQPLPGRTNYIVSKTLLRSANVFKNLDDALEMCHHRAQYGEKKILLTFF